MKKILVKSIVVIIAILFILTPILETTINYGVVKASGEWRTVTTFADSEENVYNSLKINKNTEIATIQTKEYKYSLSFSTVLDIENVTSSEAKQFDDGAVFIANLMRDDYLEGSNRIPLTESNIIRHDMPGRRYRITGTLSSGDTKYETRYLSAKEAGQPVVTQLQYKGVSASYYHTFAAKKELKSIRITWQVKPKATVNSWNTSSGNNGYIDNSQQAQEVIQQSNENYYDSNDYWNPDYFYYEEPEPVVADKNIPTSDENKRLYIRNMYRSVLERGASDDEVNAHFDHSLQRITLDIIMSDESKKKHNIDNLSNRDFVDLLYKLILKREGSANDLNHYAGDLNVGVTRDSLIYKFVESGEFLNVLNSQDAEIGVDDDSRRLFISSLYRNALGREPSAEDITSHLKNTVQTNAFDVIFSPESVKNNNIYNISNEEFVRFAYRVVLGREPDSDGFNTNVRHLNLGNTRKSLIKAFVESEEFRNKRLKSSKTISFDESVCDAVYHNLISKGFQALKTSNTSILMYEDEISQVKNLDLSGKNLKNLNGLSNFANLEKLIAQNNNFENIDELKNLSNLKYLNLNGCNLESKAVTVSSLSNLEELHLENNKLVSRNLSQSVSSLTKLQKLYVNNNKLKSITFAKNLGNLKELYADNNTISDTSLGDKKFDNLSLKNNSVSINSYGDEKELPEIVEEAKKSGNALYTSENLVLENCSVSGDMVKLNSKEGKITIKGGPADGTVVKLKNSQDIIAMKDKVFADRVKSKLGFFAKDVKEVGGTYYLDIDSAFVDTIVNLDLSTTGNDNGEIKDITGIEKFVNLKSLNLNGNKIKNFDKLAQLKNLETLSVRFNDLTSLDGLKNLTGLLQLDASNNSITDTKEIANLKKLDTLLLSNNNIENNLSGIKSLNNLVTIALTNNNVSSLEDISSLNIENCYVSQNKITNLAGMTSKESVKNIELKNNTVDIEVNGESADIPQIIKYVISKDGVNNLECVNCSINGDKIVISSGSKTAQIKVKTGNASDTVFNFKNTADVKPPKVTKIDYDLSNDKKQMRVTITTDKEIQNVLGWERAGGRNVIYKDFKYNVSNLNIVLKDFYGNETSEVINFSSVVNSEIPGLTVTYSNTMPTNQDVTVTISSTDAFRTITDSGWTKSSDRKSMTKKYTSNTDEAYTKPAVVTDTMFDNQIRPEEIDIQVLNIDRQNPECTVEYSTTQKTKGSVRATIWSDENIELVNKSNKIYKLIETIDDNGNTKHGISLYYPENTTENIEVKDLAGNKSTIQIKVNNIDKNVDGLEVNTEGMTATNGVETVVVKANEKISIGQNSGTLVARTRHLYTNTFEPVFAIAGNLNVTPIMSGNLNVISDSPTMYLSDTNLSLMANVAKANVTSSENGQELSMEVSEGDIGVVEVIDMTDNTDVAPYNTNNIDKQAPIVTRKDTKNNDGSIIVELSSNEEIQDTEDLSGWDLSADKKTLTKTFKFNGTEIITLKDLAGNEIEETVEVMNINTLNYVVYYEQIDNSNRYLVVVKADKDLSEVDGWKFLENKNEIAKVFTLGEKETLIINGISNGSAVVKIDVDSNSDNVDNQNITGDEDSITKDDKDNTQSNKILPQTGKCAGGIIALVGAVYLVIRSKKKYNKYKIK